jgi:hypothetical protein
MRLVFIVFVGALMGLAREASACECGLSGEPFAIQPASRNVYAIGRVREIRPVDPDGVYVKAVVVEITEGLHNVTTGETIVFHTPAQDSACAYHFTSGRLYVIESTYLDKVVPPIWSGVPVGSQFVNRCGMTRELQTPEGKNVMEEIRRSVEQLRR